MDGPLEAGQAQQQKQQPPTKIVERLNPAISRILEDFDLIAGYQFRTQMQNFPIYNVGHHRRKIEVLQRFLHGLALVGAGMAIGDGFLTPCFLTPVLSVFSEVSEKELAMAKEHHNC